MNELVFELAEALAAAIDAKDQTSPSHLRRVKVCAGTLARALGMTSDEVAGVEMAALLHDIGKLAVPEHILSKPGPLTQEEFTRLRIHPRVGAEIIRNVPFPCLVAPLIASHHERWDGKGYPDGLKGEEIPLGARILSVVDYFDALVTERPYHKALSEDAARGLLEYEAGRALDPQVVRTFLDMYPSLATEFQTTEPTTRKVRFGRSVARLVRGAFGARTRSSTPGTAYQDITQAHRELFALYEIAQAMGTTLGVSDTMAVLAAKLGSIVPFSCCALFLYDDETETLRCRFATGMESDTIQHFAMRNGHGAGGWVARNRRPVVNARPSADFEAAGHSPDQTSLRSALVCPLVFNERFIGTLSVYHVDSAVYTDDHRRLLDRISEQAAAVIYNSIVFEQTQEDSLTDPLTGLPNMRCLFVHLVRALPRSAREHSEVAIIVATLDAMNDINDGYGPQARDRALREVAGVLRASIGPYDIATRYEGNEFIVVLSGCGRDEAERKRVELQGRVEAIRFEPREGETLQLTLNAGAAVFPHDGDTYEKLIGAADKRLRTARLGRQARYVVH